MIILARHGQTHLNAAHQSGSAEARVQGTSLAVPLSEQGEMQAYGQGHAMGVWLRDRKISVTRMLSSGARRAVDSGAISFRMAGLDPERVEVDSRLHELCKGNLEGALRSEAYPTEEVRHRVKTDWHFRHGTGETAYEAGRRWLEWFAEVSEPYINRSDAPSRNRRALIVMGHNLVTSCGVWLLTNPDVWLDELPPLTEASQYKIANGTAMVLANTDDRWAVTDHIS